MAAADHRILSTGYNGAPSGAPGCLTSGACPRAFSDVPPGAPYDSGAGTCIAVHAEANALAYARPAMILGATMYITTWPCDDCRKEMWRLGVDRAIWPGETANSMVTTLLT
ncbi:hypothetical protein [Nonomuraea roseoviolacea]|uniref:hypothetical protein n=1 Tax=Nonomuraea roseoviolacea TaxID=103837 RepID=UPI003CD0AB70